MTVLLNVHKKLTFNQLKFICTVDIKRFHHHQEAKPGAFGKGNP